MPYALRVDKLERDGTIRVRHIFFGETEAECRELCGRHAEGCQAFAPALKSGTIIDTVKQISEIPEWGVAGDDD